MSHSDHFDVNRLSVENGGSAKWRIRRRPTRGAEMVTVLSRMLMSDGGHFPPAYSPNVNHLNLSCGQYML